MRPQCVLWMLWLLGRDAAAPMRCATTPGRLDWLPRIQHRNNSWMLSNCAGLGEAMKGQSCEGNDSNEGVT